MTPSRTGPNPTADDGRSSSHSRFHPFDADCLLDLERNMDLAQPELLGDQIEVVGAGEVSAVFTVLPTAGLGGHAPASSHDVVCKRLPLFRDRAEATEYALKIDQYVSMLRDAGVRVVDQTTSVVEVAGRPVVVYIQQRRLAAGSFGDSIVKNGSASVAVRLADDVADQCEKVFRWNQVAKAEREISIDGHFGNWAAPDPGEPPVFVDTGTPVFRLDDHEQFDPRIYLRHAPRILRAGATVFAARKLLPRYYNRRSVLLDLAANLCRVGRRDLLPVVVESLNHRLDGDPLRVDEAARYLRLDMAIWRLYHAIRRIDRFVTRHLRGRRYEFYVPPPSRK